MKIVLVLFIFLVTPTLAHASEGGSQGNGDDTRKAPTKNWITMRGNVDPNALFGPDSQQIFKATELLHRVHTELPRVVCNNSSKNSFLLRSPALKRKIQFLFHRDDSICKSEAFTKAYDEAFVLFVWLMDADEIGAYLIQTVGRLDSTPIKVVIEAAGRSTRGVTESAWFDPSDESIHWSQFKECVGMDCLVGRKSFHILRHELMHVLTHRALGSRYPEFDLDHDAKHPATREYLFELNWLKNKTSDHAAFIEGLANVVERDSGLLTGHPYIKDPGDFFGIDEKGCYQFKGEIRPKNAFVGFGYGSEIEAPTDNEVYVSSALTALLNDYDVDPRVYKGDPNAMVGAAYSTWNLRRIKEIIETVAKEAPRDVKEFAQALSKGTRSNLGDRWYLEYFFDDLKSGKNLSEWVTFQDKKGSNFDYTLACLKNKKDLKFFFSPLLWSKQIETQHLSREIFALHLRPSKLDEAIQEDKERAEAILARYDLSWKATVAGEKKLKQSLSHALYCKSTKNWCDLPETSGPFEALLEIYHSTFDQIPLCHLYNDLKTLACDGLERERRNYEVQLAQIKSNWNQLKADHAVRGTAAYNLKILNFYGLRNSYERRLKSAWEIGQVGHAILNSPKLMNSLRKL